MKCLDSTFCIDLANGSPGAMAKAEELSTTGERLAIPAPALTEFLVGAFHQGGRRLAQALEYISELEVLDVTEPISVDAARLGGECSRRGEAVGTLDLLIASTAKHHHAPLLSRDSDFARIPGLTLETY
ncbi:MAG: type II toxin-antitoxin system VapC family toxin [Thermoplasmata archaeon]|nr:type II toxin-antitoxin system VapC family toxin [Thermoplasmata archaeon]